MNTLQRFHDRLIVMSIIWLFAGTLSGVPQSWSQGPNSTGAVSIVISQHGFAQASFSVPAGSYAFVVLNRSGFHDITVYLERMPGTSVTDVPTRQEFGDTVGASRARLVRNAQLTPGTYRLRVANRPTWICAIQVN